MRESVFVGLFINQMINLSISRPGASFSLTTGVKLGRTASRLRLKPIPGTTLMDLTERCLQCVKEHLVKTTTGRTYQELGYTLK